MSLGAGLTVSSASPLGVDRRTWREVGERALRLVTVLEALGVRPGGVVGSFAWNSHRHVELYLGVPCSGRALHAVNVRLSPADVAYVVGHARDEVLFRGRGPHRHPGALARSPSVRGFVVMEDGSTCILPCREPAVRVTAGSCRARRAHGIVAGGRRRLGVLHERHDRTAQGRRLLAAIGDAALDGGAHGGRPRHPARGRRCCR
jgi:hypothetical protein